MVSFVGGWGHAEPLLPLAELITSIGRRVVFVGQQAVLPRLADLGYSTLPVGPATLGTARTPLVAVDREHERRVMRDHFVTDVGHQRAVALLQVMQEQGIELLVCDEVDVGALVAAETLGVPSVVVSVIAAGRLTSPGVIGGAWNALRRRHGLVPDPSGARLGGTLTLAPFPASFRDPSLAVPAQWRAVRPRASEIDRVRRPGRRPAVYATLGTVFNIESGDLLERLIEGLGRIDVDGLVTVGPSIDSNEFIAVPPRVQVEQFVAMRDVLGYCDAVVCHGGSGTLMAALAIGLPVVVIAMGADQPDNADRCQALGCGLVVDPVTVTASDVADAVETVLRDPTFGASAAELAEEARLQPTLADTAGLMQLLER